MYVSILNTHNTGGRREKGHGKVLYLHRCEHTHLIYALLISEWYHIETIASGNLTYNPYSALSRNKMESHLLTALISANY